MSIIEINFNIKKMYSKYIQTTYGTILAKQKITILLFKFNLEN